MRSSFLAVSLVVAILCGAGIGYLFGNANEHAIISAATTTAYSTFTVESTTTVTGSLSTTSGAKFAMPFIYLTDNGICTGPGGYVPCFGSPAYVFNECQNNLAGPATSWTCPYTVKDTISPYPSYSMNITIGVTGQPAEPQWANCQLTDTSKTVSYVECIPVINSTAFIVGEQAPPPM